MNTYLYRLRFVSVLVLSALCLSSCAADLAATRGDIADTTKNAHEGLEALQLRNLAPASPLVEESAPWYGNTTIMAQSGQYLPSNLETENALVLTFEKPLTLEQIATRIQAATNLRVTVDRGGAPSASGGASVPSSDPQQAAAGGMEMSGEPTFLPADGLEVTGGRVVWQGRLSNLLDQISDRFDAEWRYTGNSVRISQYVVRTYMLHALAGSTDVGGSVKTGSTGAESGLPTQSVDSSSKLMVWDEIQKAVDTIIPGKARASYSPTTGTITVAGYPSAVNSVEDYLRLQNKLRLRRVALEAQVLSVRLNKEYNNNFDLDVVIKDAFGNGQPFIFSSVQAAASAGGGRNVTAGLLREVPAELGNKGSAQLMISALSAVSEKITTEYSGTLVTLSDQPAPLQVATKRSYVARVSGSATDGASATTLEPGTIDIGLSMNILPRVIEQDRVMLRIALGITDLVQLRDFTSGGSTLQLPEVDTTGFLQNAVLQSGETLVLAGFERKSASDTQSGTGHPSNWLLGGGEGFSQGREIRVLMITARILPEEPVNVIRP